MEAAKAGEIRRVNLVYFLSRNGRVEHPHLIRVHHLHRHGVRLRDVKRWLAEIRGKDMPNSFSWSYKRRYRNGYVWQDLTDDDLITPISDNEYVIKGSELVVNPPPTSAVAKHRLVSLEEEKEEEASVVTMAAATAEAAEETLEISAEDDDEASLERSPPPPLMKQLDETSSSGESVGRQRAVLKIDASEEKKEVIVEAEAAEVQQKRGRAPSLLASGKDDGSGNYSKRATDALWNILKCREAGANEAALLPSASRRGHWQFSGSTASSGRTSSTGCGGDTSRGEKARSGGKGSRKAGGNGVHKPSASPLCSQCGRAFNPEKLYSHMKSCKGGGLKGKEEGSSEKILYPRASSSKPKSKSKPKKGDEKSKENPAILLSH